MTYFQHVQVTGGSGSTGFACVVHALKAGYRVRTTVRRESAIEQIKLAQVAREFSDDLEIVVVPDMTEDDAFLEALQGVAYVLHVASPMPYKVRSRQMLSVLATFNLYLTDHFLP